MGDGEKYQKMNMNDLGKYFANVEERIDKGQLRPTSDEGEQVLDQLLDVYQQLKVFVSEAEARARVVDESGRAMDELLDLVDFQARLALLMGKMIGFRLGSDFLLTRAGNQSSYFN